jgi:hypothetical protein
MEPLTRNTGVKQEITFGEEEIADVSLAAFYVFDKENVGTPHGNVKLVGGCRGCGGCSHGGCCGCGGCGCGGCGAGGYWCLVNGVWTWCSGPFMPMETHLQMQMNPNSGYCRAR